MNQHFATSQKNSRAWIEVPAEDNGDAIVAALAEAGVEYVFFTSGSEIAFYQEAIAKARATGRKAPKLITVTHEHASLNAALGCAAVSRKPVVTAAHVDCGTQHYGGAVHTAMHSGLPVLITAGIPPVAYPGSMRGARDGGHLWMQQRYDQNSIVREYVKWDHKLEFQDNPGLMISRALQVACSEPSGPVYLSLPREVSFAKVDGARFPTLAQLGVARPPAPDPGAIRDLALRLVNAENPVLVVARSGRNPATVPALVRLCEFLGLPVAQSAQRSYHCFPLDHPLYLSASSLKDSDLVLALEVDIPWMPGSDAPPDSAFVVIIDVDPAKDRIPTMEFTADLRLTADSLQTIEALEMEVHRLTSTGGRSRFAARAAKCASQSAARRKALADDAQARSTAIPIDPRWLSYNIGKIFDDNCILFDETIAHGQVHDYLPCRAPASYFHNPGSSGGWSPGAAFGAKLAAPDKDVIAVCGDGFYMFGTPIHALWAAVHYKAPFMAVVYQNRSYSTGTLRLASAFPDGHAARGGFDGGYFDPPIDFAKEAQAAGAYGENVTDPKEVEPALRRGLAQIRAGTPAVISVWLPRLLQKD
jgi:acetolactate synthase-1/2/3 large subunit